jgi:hypothetical protein
MLLNFCLSVSVCGGVSVVNHVTKVITAETLRMRRDAKTPFGSAKEKNA